MLEKIKTIRSVIRKNSRYNIPISVLWLSIFGSIINVTFSYFVIPDLSVEHAGILLTSSFSWMIPAAFYIYLRREKEITETIYNIKNKIQTNPGILKIAQQKLTARPKFVALLVFAFWLIAATQNSLLAYLFEFINLRSVIFLFLGIGFMANPIISTLTYLLVEIMSRNDMRVLEIEIELDSPKFSIRYKILFTMIFLSSLFIFLLTSISLTNLRELSNGLDHSIHNKHILQSIAISTMSVIYIIITAFLVSKSITDPIKELNIAMKKVAIGDIEINAHIISTDEVGSLAKGFNLMTSGLRERDNIKKIFGHYVSTEIRDEILSGSFELGGQSLEATVLFADIRNFTTLSETYSPEEIVEMLNQYFTEMVHAISNNGGVVDKFIGDAVMAIFGAPKNTGNHAKQAIAAAKEMLSRLEAHNFLQIQKNQPEFQIGIGINTGILIMGNIGAENRKEFTVIGDTVNTASRIESVTKIYKKEILFSESTYKLLGEGIFIDEVDLKGKQSKIKIYSPV